MHVGTAGEEPNLSVVPPSVAVVADVQGLVKVADQVDDEPQGDASFLDRPGGAPRMLTNSVSLSTTHPFPGSGPENRASYRGSSSGTST
jgi:hypothetical protein